MKNKIKIMNTKPEISENEIRSYMDFDKVLQQNAKTIRKNPRVVRNFMIIGACSGIIFSAWFFTQHRYDEPVVKTNESKSVTTFHPYASQQDSILSDNKQTETAAEVQQLEQLNSSRLSGSQERNTLVQKKPAKKSSEPKEELMLSPVYTQAIPVKGYPALYEYFFGQLHYPEEALADSVQGVVTVVFTINTAGRPEKITIEQSLGEAFDREAIRLIENMPDWNPATYNGNPVLSKISLPITFNVKRLTPKE
jgi:TonB family protein